jgi:regulator of protease activity HflC (stomatin/prohibitin superfamily)
MSEREVRERDILVASNEFAYVQDLTKGDIVLYVGPTKISLSNTERLVDFRHGRFLPVRAEDGGLGVSPFVAASSSQYIVLENPTKDPTGRPVKGNNSAAELLTGRKVVVPGPASFPLWPGQRAKVVDGHELGEDEYLVVRVYENIDGDDRPIGTQAIVRGEDVRFFIPRTGIEVLATEAGYVRRSWRLRKGMGLHVRVIKPFTAGPGDQVPAGAYEAGQEIFLSDREGFFFPTENVEVVGTVMAIPLAEKEGVYVRAIGSGRITTISGPCNYLADPTEVEIVTRPLDPSRAALYGIAPPAAGRALSVYVPPSFAVLVTAKDKREVVRGPKTRILEFDEELETLRLSTGRPKSDDAVLPTCFLQVEGNKVSDVVRMKTADHVELEVLLSYRVSFVTTAGPSERWFNVRDYVGLLCDHLGSILRAAARTVSIDAFHNLGTEILRSAILGEKKGTEPREGRTFEENGMWVYDVEVLEATVLDADVNKLLGDAQRTAIVAEVKRRQEELRLLGEKQKEAVDREIHAAQLATLTTRAALEAARHQLESAKSAAQVELDRVDKVGRASNLADAFALETAARIGAAEKQAELDRRALEASVVAFRGQMDALAPELIATLKSLGNQHLATELTRHASPLAILGGESVADVVDRLLRALPIGPSGEGIKQVLPRTSAPAAAKAGPKA